MKNDFFSLYLRLLQGSARLFAIILLVMLLIRALQASWQILF